MPLLNFPVSGRFQPAAGGAYGSIKLDNVVHCIIVFLTAFLVYFWSAPRTVGLEDDGYFVLAAYFNGIAHPPGYPLYTLLAHLATLIPFGSVALRVHLLSGLLGALACVCLWCITRILTRDRTAAWAAALAFAFSRVFWSQAIIAKGIYTLNVFLILTAFLCILAVRNRGQGREAGREIQLLFLCYGLALSNHWPLVILTTPMFIGSLWPQRNEFYRFVKKGLPFLLLGLTPYLWMAIRSQMDPEIIFFGPIETVSDFWRYLSRQPYAEVDYSPSAGWIDKAQYMQYVLVQTGAQFGPFGWLFVLTGVVCQWRKLPVEICSALVLGYLGSSVFLILLLGFDYEEYRKALFSVYPLISYVVASIWLGIGLASAVDLLMRKPALSPTRRIVPAGFSALIIISTFFVNAAWNYRHDDDWARLYAVTVLDSLPRGAILFSAGMGDGAIAYMHEIEGYRKDVDLYSAKGVLLKNRLYHPLKATTTRAGKAIAEFITLQNRPVYDISGLFPDYKVAEYGLFSRLSKNNENNIKSVIVMPELLNYWNFLLLQKVRHPWENIHRAYLLGLGCNLLTLAKRAPARYSSDYAQIEKMRARLCDNLRGSNITLTALMQSDNPDWDQVALHLDKAAGQLHEALLKSDIAQLDYYRGMMYLQTGHKEKGRYYLEQSLAQWNHPDNEAGVELKKLTR